jgi:hypothetical protein
MSPSLGWLQAFLCAADHCDYERAARDLGTSAARIKLRVEKLEQWLHKILILDDPTEVNEGDGAQFISIAWEALIRFEAVCSGCNFSITGLGGAPRTERISKIRLHDLERFLALANEGTFKGAAAVSRCDVATIHRSIEQLENVSGNRLFFGRVTVQLTGAGDAFKDAASFILKSLNDFTAIIPDDYDPAIASVRNLHSLLKVRKVELQSIASIVTKTGKKQRGKVRLTHVAQASSVIAKAIDKTGEQINIFPSHSGSDADVSGLGVLRKPDCKTGD